MSTTGLWSPGAYPTQSCISHPSNNCPNLEPEEIHPKLPTIIRAVQDSVTTELRGRNLVICLDGTGDQFDSDNSNVVNFVACMKKDDPSQVTYYQSGIGTYDGRGMTKGISAAVDMAIGSGLGVHIRDAYHFLMQNYQEGDRICLLGFSRGSYTVRCLAGMLHKVGLLPRHNIAQVSFAYKFYKDDTKEGRDMSEEFKKTFCIDVNVYYVGVFDCVASVGFIPRKLPFSKTPTNSIRYFRHAMALDEHRAKFEVLQWGQQDLSTNTSAIDNISKAKAKSSNDTANKLHKSRSHMEEEEGEKSHRKWSSSTSSTFFSSVHLKKLEKPAKEIDTPQEKLSRRLEDLDHSIHLQTKTDVKEIWFVGAHADIGGGAVPNDERHKLSRIPLRWMIRQCFECNTGILFHTAALAEVGLDVTSLWPAYKKTGRPVVGPSPDMVERYKAGTLPPLRRRPIALGIRDKQPRQNADGCHDHDDEVEEVGARSYFLSDFDLLPEHVEDYFDVISPVNDQLEQAKGWWILEFWPVKVRVQKKPDQWKKVVRMNMGRFRAIRETEPSMHWTVHMRMSDKKYKVRNRMDKDVVWQIAT